MATAKSIKARWLRLVLVVTLLSSFGMFFSPVSPASAGTGGCRAASCIGLDPTGRCDGDAYTARSIAIVAEGRYAGQLDLRYSPSCVSNWGRFSVSSSWRDLFGAIAIGGRVTAWNIGQPSQPPVQSSLIGVSTWSRMVDGSKLACTGVEPYISDPSGSGNVHSGGWFWGPCA